MTFNRKAPTVTPGNEKVPSTSVVVRSGGSGRPPGEFWSRRTSQFLSGASEPAANAVPVTRPRAASMTSTGTCW